MDSIYLQPVVQRKYAVRGFWRRQFGDSPTAMQLRFDVALGLIVPMLCFALDPIVFHGWMRADGGVLARFRLFVYGASAIEMATLAFWLFAVWKYPAWSRPAGGVMFVGGLFSALIGVVILPFSIIGIVFVGVGLLGFIPFVTAVVYLRNGVRALRLYRCARPVRGSWLAAFAFGLLVAIAVPAAAQLAATRALGAAFDEVAAGGELSPRRARAMRAISYVSGARLESRTREYEWTQSAERRAQLAKAYAEVTGRDIENRTFDWDD
jgi:hypothetical protein